MIVVAIIGLLAAIAVPAYSRARENSVGRACVNNLRLINGAKEQYGFENSGTTPASLGDMVPTYISKTPVCKGGGTYSIGALGTEPTCDVGAGHAM